MRLAFLASFALLLSRPALAQTKVELRMVDEKGIGKSVGEVSLTETRHGVVLSPSLAGLPPGLHGFHVHENPSCESGEEHGKRVAALAAGGHLDPFGSKSHGLPWADGHLGDLPPLFVDAKGNADQPVLAPRLKLADLKGRSLMIHVGGDNHADHPAPLGGGGARLACGVIRSWADSIGSTASR